MPIQLCMQHCHPKQSPGRVERSLIFGLPLTLASWLVGEALDIVTTGTVQCAASKAGSCGDLWGCVPAPLTSMSIERYKSASDGTENEIISTGRGSLQGALILGFPLRS